MSRKKHKKPKPGLRVKRVPGPASRNGDILPPEGFLEPVPVSGERRVDLEDLLEHSRANWQVGNWQKLADLTEASIEHHPERDKLALLAAAGLAQTGNLAGSKRMALRARDWGCSPALLARVLISGAMNSLGRAAMLLQDEARASQFFQSSIEVVTPQSDGRVLGRIRNVHEKTRLGLLPEAAKLLALELAEMAEQRVAPSAREQMFKTELEVLSAELSLAQQRHQLSAGPVPVATPEDRRARLAERSVSQLGQDLWVLDQVNHKTGGFFVEFGATDGVLLSNTYLLETEFTWTGLLAEPNPKLFEKLRQNRKCTLSSDCIMGKSGLDVSFVLADVYGGVLEFAVGDSHEDKRGAYIADGNVIKLRTISLHDFLEKHQAPRQIDYISIDTEGSEFDILSTFPFERWDVRCFTVEHNFTARRKDIRLLMERHGYRCVEVKFDDWFVRPA